MSELRLGLVGVESSHAVHFTRLLNSGQVAGGKVVAVWGETPTAGQTFAQQMGIHRCVSTLEELCHEVDGVLICGRWGEDHLWQAKPFLEAGLPTFVDKPLAHTLSAAQAIIELAQAYQAPLMSGTALRFAREMQELAANRARLGRLTLIVSTGPAFGTLPDPRARGLTFYGIHAAEVLVSLAGRGGQVVGHQVTPYGYLVSLTYPDGHMGVLHLPRSTRPYYHVAVYGAEGCHAVEITDVDGFYSGLLRSFLQMVRSRVPAVSPEDSLEALRILSVLDPQIAH
ncbi:MAG: Gfo/Idh/MocA family oxidoreductase [Anaerolineae bacterium]|nr:Gfo/Idh/MocA family oxidoreductase [Anaerolineae bacterium]MDW8099983.1 Gfo/Idh/MocA family oxidoreductase [Anaerolineae bacterium]